VAERADFIALDTRRLDVAAVFFVVLDAGFTKLSQELQDGVLGQGDDPAGSIDPNVMHRSLDELEAGLSVELVRNEQYACSCRHCEESIHSYIRKRLASLRVMVYIIRVVMVSLMFFMPDSTRKAGGQHGDEDRGSAAVDCVLWTGL